MIERVILGRAQAFADGAERFEEGVEIGVTVECAKFFHGRGGVELMQRFGLDRAFQVQMQLGLRQRPRGNRPYLTIRLS